MKDPLYLQQEEHSCKILYFITVSKFESDDTLSKLGSLNEAPAVHSKAVIILFFVHCSLLLTLCVEILF